MSADERLERVEETLVEVEGTLGELVHKVAELDVEGSIEAHIQMTHMKSNQEITYLIEEHHDQTAVLERVVTALDGEKRKDMFGNVIGHEPGLMDIVRENNETLTAIKDQRIRHVWTRNQKIALAGVLVTLFFSALPGIVTAVRWLAETIVGV